MIKLRWIWAAPGETMIDPLYSLSGFLVGLLVGMTGVGGGALMTPILILLFGIHPATAVGTDLLYAAATKTGGSLVHGLARSIDWRVVMRLASGSIPATVVTLAVLSHFNLNGEAARGLITLVLSIALFATAMVLVFGGAIVAAYRARVTTLDARRTAGNTVLVGALLGVLVYVFGLGPIAVAGVVVVGLLLAYEHSLVSANDLSRLNAAFFTMNGVISMVFLVFVTANFLVR